MGAYQLRLDPTISTFAFLVRDKGFVETRFVEIGPQCVRHPDFGIGDLPEKKVADAEFSARADQEIGIRKAGGIKIITEFLFRDRCSGLLSSVGQNPVHGVDDFCTTTVIEGETEDHSAVVCRLGDGLEK